MKDLHCLMQSVPWSLAHQVAVQREASRIGVPERGQKRKAQGVHKDVAAFTKNRNVAGGQLDAGLSQH
jgi:hypothetical protein